MTDLKRQWLLALDASAAAIVAAARAHLLSAEESRRGGRLAAERAWLEVVDWTALELGHGASIAALERPAPMTQPSLVRAA